jgi:hypothetical protein
MQPSRHPRAAGRERISAQMRDRTFGVEIRRKRHGLAGFPFRRSVFLDGGCSPARAIAKAQG